MFQTAVTARDTHTHTHTHGANLIPWLCVIIRTVYPKCRFFCWWCASCRGLLKKRSHTLHVRASSATKQTNLMYYLEANPGTKQQSLAFLKSRTGLSGIHISVGKTYFSLLQNVQGSFLGKGRRSTNLTTHLHLEPKLRKSWAIFILFYVPSWRRKENFYTFTWGCLFDFLFSSCSVCVVI